MSIPRPVKAEVLGTHTRKLFHGAVQRAAELLRRGSVVALPTETVYGLAANALDGRAVARIFEAKKRPANNPIIVHVDGTRMAKECVREWPPLAGKLAKAFWPGPLTLVLPRSPAIPDIVTAGGDTVAIRWPRHRIVQAVISACGFPLAAPSANPSGRVSPTTAEHVLNTLGERIPLVVDGGPSEVGIESTVLDLSVDPPAILRPGMIGEKAITEVAGEIATHGTAGAGGLYKSPGRLPRHYSPKARLVVSSWKNAEELRELAAAAGIRPGDCHVIARSQIRGTDDFGQVAVLSREPESYAKALYAELHRADAAGARLIIMEELPAGAEWRAIADRLRRASQGCVIGAIALEDGLE